MIHVTYVLYLFVWLALFLLPFASHSQELCDSTAKLEKVSNSFFDRLDGFKAWRLNGPSSNISDLEVFRLEPRMWRIRAYDMRDMRQLKASKGIYSAPRYTIRELKDLVEGDTIVTSGGFTQSMEAPIPTGLVKLNNYVRNPIINGPKELDGNVCVRANGQVLIATSYIDGKLRPSSQISACRDAIQAGPVLIYNGVVQIKSNFQNVSRVFIGVDDKDRIIIGYSSSASTHALACTLLNADINVKSAITLQSDILGGISFGGNLRRVVGKKQLGSIDELIASAFLFQYLPKDIGPN